MTNEGRLLEALDAGIEPVDLAFDTAGGARLARSRGLDAGLPRPAIDSVFTLEEAASAFERNMAADKRGDVVLEIAR